jgi:hypothetical protein
VSDSRTTSDLLGGIMGVAALVMSLLQLVWWPMLFGPLALLCLVVAVMVSPRYSGLYQTAAVVLAVGFVVGASVAVVADNPLY